MPDRAAKDTSPSQKQKQPQPPMMEQEPVEPELAPPGADLAAGWMAAGGADANAGSAARQQALVRAQRAQGNAFVQRLVQRAPLQRAPDEQPPAPQAAAPQPGGQPAESVIEDLSGLGAQREMPGHGSGGGIREGASTSVVMLQPQAGVTANITLTVNPPTISRVPQAQIASSHGRAGVAGWTTPAYNLSDPVVSGNSVSIRVTLDFNIEIASERSGQLYNVIADHEQGHVNIGRNQANTHLVTGFKTALEAMPRLTRSGYVAARDAAANNFTTGEGTESQVYDNTDYPRMALANTGASTPLATLASHNPAIATMVSKLRRYNLTMMTGRDWFFNIYVIDDATVVSAANEVTAAFDALDPDIVSLLQYNEAFKNLVGQASMQTEAFLADRRRGTLDNPVPMDENVNPATRSALENLKSALMGFTWVSPV